MKLLVVCGHTLFRQGLVQLVKQVSDDPDILEAGNFSQALGVVNQHPDLSMVLLSMELADINGWTALDIIKGHREELPVVVLSSAEDYGSLRRALVAGAQGYICQSSSGPTLIEAVKAVLNGEIYVPPESLIRPAGGTGAAEPEPSAPPPGGKTAAEGAIICRLTPRQLDVLKLIKNGKSNKEIARSLELAEGTVKIHCMAIFRELGVTNRTQAAMRAEQLLP